MSVERTVTTEAGDLPETDDRFITVEALPHDFENSTDHVRFSVKFQSDARLEVHSIAIQPFRDETTPHFHMGVQLEPEKLDDFITALENSGLDPRTTGGALDLGLVPEVELAIVVEDSARINHRYPIIEVGAVRDVRGAQRFIDVDGEVAIRDVSHDDAFQCLEPDVTD